MSRGTFRGAVVAAAMVALTVGPVPAAQATHSWCSSGPAFTAVTADTVTGGGPDWWSTTATGLTRIVLAAADPGAWFQVYTTPNGNCTVVCSSPRDCTVTHTGPLHIAVYGAIYAAATPYVLTVADADATDCTQPLSVCVATVTGTEVARMHVRIPTTHVARTHTASGAVATYRFPLPNGAFVTVPCVTLTVNRATNNPCADAGGQYVATLAELVEQSVSEPGVALSPPIGSVGVCETRVTVTVATIGVENFPAYALC